MHRLTLLVALLLSAGACNKTPSNPSPRSPAPSADASKISPRKSAITKPKPKPVRYPADPFRPNDLYYVTADSSKQGIVVRVTDGKFQRVKLPCTQIVAMTANADGTVLASCSSTIHRIRGGAVTTVGEIPRGLAWSMAQDKAGAVWATTRAQVLRYLHGKASVIALDPAAGGQISTLIADSQGRIWIATPTALYRRDGDRWTSVDYPQRAQKPGSRTLVPLAGGGLLLKHGLRLFRYADGRWSNARYRGTRMAATPTGLVVAQDYNQTIWVFEPDGRRTSGRHRTKGQYLGRDAMAMAHDGRRRSYLSSRFGLVLIDAQGVVTQWEPGRVPEFASGAIALVVVAGNGPRWPTPKPAIRGTLKGQLSGHAGVAVQLCPPTILRVYYGDTPCEFGAVRLKATTDEQGRFEIPNVPPYRLMLVYKVSRSRWARRDPRCCSELKPGEIRSLPAMR